MIDPMSAILDSRRIILRFLPTLAVCSALFAQSPEQPQPRGRVLDLVRQAQQAGRSEVKLPYLFLEYFRFKSLEDSLRTIPLVLGTLQEKRTIIIEDGSDLQTYMRFSVDKWIGPVIPGFEHDMPAHVPKELRTLSAQDIVVTVPDEGEMVHNGVTVVGGNGSLSKFVVGQTYLMFLTFNSDSKLGGFPFAATGVWKVDPGNSGKLIPMRADGDPAKAFLQQGIHSVADAEAYAAK